MVALFLLIGILSAGCGTASQVPEGEQPNEEVSNSEVVSETGDQDIAKEVEQVVKDFGSKLQNVSLMAPEDVLSESMKENYGNYVSEELIEKWLSDPLNAPGRLTSSPWPDRIEITTVEKLSEDEYQVEGTIIEITSENLTDDGITAKRPITLLVKQYDGKWLIEDVTMGDYVNE